MAALSSLISLIGGRLGRRTDLDSTILAELIQAQSLLEKTPPYPWWLTNLWAVSISAASQTVPTGFIEFVEDAVFILGVTGGAVYAPPKSLEGGYFEHVQQASTSTGRPVNYTLVGTDIWWFKAPNVPYDLRALFYRKETALTDASSSNQWCDRGDDLLMAYAGYEVARTIRDQGAQARFQEDMQRSRARQSAENTSRLESMRRAVIGAGEDAMVEHQP